MISKGYLSVPISQEKQKERFSVLLIIVFLQPNLIFFLKKKLCNWFVWSLKSTIVPHSSLKLYEKIHGLSRLAVGAHLCMSYSGQKVWKLRRTVYNLHLFALSTSWCQGQLAVLAKRSRVEWLRGNFPLGETDWLACVTSFRRIFIGGIILTIMNINGFVTS